MAEDEDKDENENEGEDERLRKVGKASRWRKEDRKTVKSVDGKGRGGRPKEKRWGAGNKARGGES